MNETLLTKLADSSGYPSEGHFRVGAHRFRRDGHGNQTAVIRINPNCDVFEPATPLS